jgi:Cu/Ag efflux protein CusF
MTRRLFVAMGLCLAFAAMPVAAQEKPAAVQDKKVTAKPDRVEGSVQSIDKATKTVTIRLRGKTNTVPVVFSDKTMFTFRNKAGSLDEVKEGRNVICLGRYNDKVQLIATRIDVRDEK